MCCRAAGQPLVLTGGGAYHAAVHCAAVAAAQRQRKRTRRGSLVRRIIPSWLRGAVCGNSMSDEDAAGLETSQSPQSGVRNSVQADAAAMREAGTADPVSQPAEAHIAVVQPVASHAVVIGAGPSRLSTQQIAAEGIRGSFADDHVASSPKLTENIQSDAQAPAGMSTEVS